MLHYTPTIEELLPNHEIKCNQPNCSSIFTNMGNYKMHLIRHHKMPKTNDDLLRVYHCPGPKCPYNADNPGKPFKSLKYLRQHYQKVHLEKKHKCANCSKCFSTVGHLLSHSKRECGKKFRCKQCSWEYETMEALLTHVKRKGHVVDTDGSKNARLPGDIAVITKSTLKKTCKGESNLKTTSTLSTPCDARKTSVLFCSTSTSTNIGKDYLQSNNLDCSNGFQPLHRDSETQTDTFDKGPVSDVSGIFDQIFSESSHMHTQTCSDFFSGFELADIQTQTISTSLSQGVQHNSFNTSSTNTSFCYDDLFISTETQTSFSDFLFRGPMNGDASDILYTQTQYTQTCPELEGLLEDRDLLNGFQAPQNKS